jgi:hypothetical protein
MVTLRRTILVLHLNRIWVPRHASSDHVDHVINDAGVVLSEVVASSSTSSNNNLLESKQSTLPLRSPTPPPDPAATPSTPEMAVFEVDPLSWLCWGHEIIDGGPTGLPRVSRSCSYVPMLLHLHGGATAATSSSCPMEGTGS